MDLLGRSATRRRFLGLSFVAAASTVLAACSSGQSGSPTTAPSSSSAAPTSASAAPTTAAAPTSASAAATAAPTTAATAAPAANAAPSTGTVTIQAWIPWQDKPSVAAFQKLLSRFEQEKPKYKVNPTWGATEDKTLTSISGGSPPDSFMYWDATYVGTWAQTGAIIDITPWMTANGLQNKLTLGALRLVKVAGKYYACPYMTDGYMFMYNKDVFDKAGLKPPTTMEEIASLSAQLTKKDSSGKITQVGYHPLYGGCCSASNMGMWAMQMGGKWYDDTKKLVTADDAGNVAALQWEMDFYTKYGIPAMNNFLSGLGKEATPTDPMASGTTLMAIQGEWRTGGAYGVAAANPNFKYGLAPIPYSSTHPELKNANFATGTAASIPKSAKNGQAALDLIGWILVLENQIEISNGIGNLPATLEGLGAHDKLTLEGMGPYAQYLLQSNEAGNVYAWPAIPVSKQYSDTLVKEEQLAVGGKASAKDALKSVNQQIQPQLDAALQSS